jgi:hypothetical protein
MKKIFLAGILSILFVGISFAQSPKIGITAGLNVSNVNESGTDATSNDFKAGFQAGLVADFSITESFSIIPELLFGQRGYKTSGKVAGVDFTQTTTLNYLQLPVNAAYKFNVGYGSKLFIFAGPYIGYGISAKASGGAEELGGIDISQDLKFGSNEALKAFDFGLNVGVGYQYDKVFFKLQYNQGLTNIYNIEGVTGKNQNIAVSVGYFFN